MRPVLYWVIPDALLLQPGYFMTFLQRNRDPVVAGPLGIRNMYLRLVRSEDCAAGRTPGAWAGPPLSAAQELPLRTLAQPLLSSPGSAAQLGLPLPGGLNWL